MYFVTFSEERVWDIWGCKRKGANVVDCILLESLPEPCPVPQTILTDVAEGQLEACACKINCVSFSPKLSVFRWVNKSISDEMCIATTNCLQTTSMSTVFPSFICWHVIKDWQSWWGCDAGSPTIPPSPVLLCIILKGYWLAETQPWCEP